MVGESKNVVTSRNYEEHMLEILEYSIATFGHRQTSKYFNTISQLVERLEFDFTSHSECRYLATKSRKYRNIHLDSHLIVYRITEERIEVLDIVHCRSSIRKIRSVRKIRI